VGVGMVLLVGISVLRLRYSWWPLHPVLILTMGSGALGKFCFSFLLGWLLKVAIAKFGGTSKYEQFKPMLIGIIVGDLGGAFFIMLANWIYFAATGIAAPGGSWVPW